MCIGYKNILVNLDDAPKVERTYRSGDLHHERAQRATYSSETLENVILSPGGLGRVAKSVLSALVFT